MTVIRGLIPSPNGLSEVPSTIEQAEMINIELTVAPNPAISYLNVLFELEQEVSPTAVLEIVSINGQVHYSQQVSIVQGQNTFELNISDIPSGMHFVRLVGETLLGTENFVRQQD